MAWKKIASVSDLSDGQGKSLEVDGKELALFKAGGNFYCIDGRCTHRRGELGDGELEDKLVVCPLHGSKFDITNGKVQTAPAKENVNSYPTKVEGDDVLVDL